MSRQRSSIEYQDIVAATYVVGTDLIEADYLTLQDAIDNLPDSGGSVFVLGLEDTGTITLPDKSTEICFAAGVTISRAGATTIFVVPDGLTARREYIIDYLRVRGDQSAGQVIVKMDDSSAFGAVWLNYVDVEGIDTVVNFSKGDLSYKDSVYFYIDGGTIRPFAGVTNPFVVSSSPAGSFAFSSELYLNNVVCYTENPQSYGWNFDFDGDILFGNAAFGITGACSLDGIDMNGSTYFQGPAAGGASLETLGSSFFSCGDINNGFIYQINLILSFNDLSISNCTFSGPDMKVTANGLRISIANSKFRASASGLNPATDYWVDVLAGADKVAITGCAFTDATIAAIRTAATGGAIGDCSFLCTSTHNTVLETGGADSNKIDNCPGLNTGGGPAPIGPSTTVEGARLASKTATSTAALVTAVPQIANPLGLQGVGWVKNTGANDIDVKETFTDAFGTSSTLTSTVTAGNTQPLSLGIAIGTGLPPYVSYKVEVIDTVAGNHSTYVVRFTSQGAL